MSESVGNSPEEQKEQRKASIDMAKMFIQRFGYNVNFHPGGYDIDRLGRVGCHGVFRYDNGGQVEVSGVLCNGTIEPERVAVYGWHIKTADNKPVDLYMLSDVAEVPFGFRQKLCQPRRIETLHLSSGMVEFNLDKKPDKLIRFKFQPPPPKPE